MDGWDSQRSRDLIKAPGIKISFLNPYIKGANNLAPQQQSCLPFFPSHFLIIFRNQSCLAIFRFWVSEIVVHELEEKGSIATVYIMLK
ncbi:hypothetical protein QL285_011304 [Trifolium repens]|nr:hypothetical protein QL285_011304 [Trifolium repens]